MSARLAAALLVSYAALARADIPPPGGETCSLEKQPAAAGCEACSADHTNPQACAGEGAKGLIQVCRTSGATVWTEIWCKGGNAPNFAASDTKPASSTPAPATPKGCASAPISALALLSALFARRQRRTSP